VQFDKENEKENLLIRQTNRNLFVIWEGLQILDSGSNTHVELFIPMRLYYYLSTSSPYGDDLSTISSKIMRKKNQNYLAGAFPAAGVAVVDAAGAAPGAWHTGAVPVTKGLTLEHLAVVGAPLNLRSTLFSSTPSHGTALLQIRTTPSAVPEVPLTFLNEILLNFIFDGF